MCTSVGLHLIRVARDSLVLHNHEVVCAIRCAFLMLCSDGEEVAWLGVIVNCCQTKCASLLLCDVNSRLVRRWHGWAPTRQHRRSGWSAGMGSTLERQAGGFGFVLLRVETWGVNLLPAFTHVFISVGTSCRRFATTRSMARHVHTAALSA